MSVYLQDPDVTIHQGDVLDELRNMPDESVHMCVTSPPFYGLRDYGTGTWEGGDEGCDHVERTGARGGANGRSVGTGRHTHATFHGSMSTTYDGGPMYYGHICGKCGAQRVDQQIGLEATPDLWVARLVDVFRELRRVLRDDGTLWVEIGDSYGANTRGNSPPPSKDIAPDPVQAWNGAQKTQHPHPYKPKDLIGAPWLLAFALRADGWYLRSEIIWAKPNPMPESVTDRPTTSHSRVFLLAKIKDYYYDAEAIREPQTTADHHDRYHAKGSGNDYHNKVNEANGGNHGLRGQQNPSNPAGRNRRTVWTIATQPYPEAHFATWPEKLVEPMILAGCPEGGTVLDPFGGSGTTAHVARKLGRRAVLIELNAEYCALAARRLQQLSLLA